MNSIKSKIFLPLIITIIMICAYIYMVWIPSQIAFAKGNINHILDKTLEVVGDQIAQDIVNKKMREVNERLDLILLKNPDWKYIELMDDKGKVLYPPFSEPGSLPTVSDNDIQISERDITAFGQKIGSLKLFFDFSDIYNRLTKRVFLLFGMIMWAMVFFSATAFVVLYLFVVKPARLLSIAADKMAQTADSIDSEQLKLPAITEDEIGTLVKSFSRMRETIETEQRQLKIKNKELEEAIKKAEAANQAKPQFLANMSHELRTPMNGIIGLSRLLYEEGLDKDHKATVLAILQSGETLLLLLNDILDFSKIEAGELLLEEIPFKLKRSLKIVMELLSPLASKKKLKLKYTYDDKLPEIVIGDPTRLNQIITNLVGNAIKFTNDGYVHLSVFLEKGAEEKDQILVIKVEDSGIGISSEQQSKLFKKFMQADVSMGRKYGGTGLGLAISKELVEVMHGNISVESEAGKGATFIVKLPIKLPSGNVAENYVDRGNQVQQQKKTTFSKYKILIVDDHPVNMLFAEKLLKKMGFLVVDAASNGREALEKIIACGAAAYDLVLMDCQMPEMDGFEACRHIRERETQTNRRLPVIAMTAHAMEGDRERCLRAGMDDYISKPVNPDKLRAVLSNWLPQIKETATQPENLQIITEAFIQDAADPVDMRSIRIFADGNAEQEKMFIEIFLKVAEESLGVLRENIHGIKTNDDWRMAAHKLKGSSGQIGAEALSRVCMAAEKDFASGAAEKEGILHEIEKKFGEVREFLKKLC